MPRFVQPLLDTNGEVVSISPLLTPETKTKTGRQTVLLYPKNTDSVNHGHTAVDAILHLDANQMASNDRYASTEEGLMGMLSANGTTYANPSPRLA